MAVKKKEKKKKENASRSNDLQPHSHRFQRYVNRNVASGKSGVPDGDSYFNAQRFSGNTPPLSFLLVCLREFLSFHPLSLYKKLRVRLRNDGENIERFSILDTRFKQRAIVAYDMIVI